MLHRLFISALCGIILLLATAWASPRATAEPSDLTEREIAFVAGLHPVRLGVWTNAPPYMLPGSDQGYQGMVADFAALVTLRTGISFQAIPYDSFAQAWEAAVRGDVDALAAVTASDKHRAAFNLSKPYLNVPIALMTREDYPRVLGLRDLLGKTVVVGKGHVTEQWIRRDYPDVKLVLSEDYSQGLMLVARGKADAYAGPLGAMLHFARENELSNLRLATATEYHYHLGFAVRKDWPLLPEILNKAIAFISPKEQADIRNRWIVLQTEKTVDWGMVISISLLIAFAAAVLVFFINTKNRHLRKEIADRKRIEKELRDATRRLNDILEFLPDPTWGIDTQGRVIFWNRAMERLSGSKAKDILGKGNYEYSLPFYGERRPVLLDLVLKRDPQWEDSYLHLEADNGTLAISESFHPILGENGVYLTGSAARLYDSEGNLVGAVETVRDITPRKLAEAERERLIDELKQALANVKALSGLLPICAHCKKIRDDKGYWSEVEDYIRKHSEAGFSHGICPDCMEKHYPDLAESVKKNRAGD